MIALVIGYGSIGQRHCRLLQSLGLDANDIYVADLQEDRVASAVAAGHRIFDLKEQSDSNEFDVIVVASSTASHIEIIKNIPIAKRLLYIEKPLAHNFLKVAPVARQIKRAMGGVKVVVGYMLRQHPAVQKVKNLLKDESLGKILKYRAECGMFLPNWHPWEDYRDFYMSDIDGGGGALLDISHEIDLLSYLAGPSQRVFGLLGNLSDLECTSDDYSEIILHHKNNVIGSISLDLIQKDTFRKTRIVFEKGEVEINFIDKSIRVHNGIGKSVLEEYELGPDDLYIRQYKDALDENGSIACSLDEALSVMEIIHAVRRSSEVGGFINLPIYSGVDG